MNTLDSIPSMGAVRLAIKQAYAERQHVIVSERETLYEKVDLAITLTCGWESIYDYVLEQVMKNGIHYRDVADMAVLDSRLVV